GAVSPGTKIFRAVDAAGELVDVEIIRIARDVPDAAKDAEQAIQQIYNKLEVSELIKKLQQHREEGAKVQAKLKKLLQEAGEEWKEMPKTDDNWIKRIIEGKEKVQSVFKPEKK